MLTNFVSLFVAALVPLILASLYYYRIAVAKSWMKVNGLTPEYLKSSNMLVLLGTTYVLSLMIGVLLAAVCIHQNGIASLFFDDLTNPLYLDVLASKGDAFRSFGHGAVHGFITSLCLAFPIIGINALFEKRGWQYIFIHTCFWALSLTIMGGIICMWP